MRVSTVLLSVLVCVQVTLAAKILGVFPMRGKSHMIINLALVKELAIRGHDVTVITFHPEKDPPPNYHEIILDESILDNIWKKDGRETSGRPNPFTMKNMNVMKQMIFLWVIGTGFCEVFLQEPSVQKLIHSEDEHFDLVIMEAFVHDCALGFAHKFKAPVVQICSFGGATWMNDWFGNPYPYSYVPNGLHNVGDRMTFSERVSNTLGGVYQQLGRSLFYLPKQDAVVRKYFNYTNDFPYITELEKSTALVLFNHHFSISYPRPLMPNMIQVGGMHIVAPKKLPQDIQKFIEDAPDGVIFFSMGSNLESSKMPEEKLQAILKAFSQLKQRILWKWETDTLPGQPKNVKLGKWLPQSDILAHPKVKLFMTHGGLLSTLETISRGVPVVGIPIYGDQELNMGRVEAAGFGIALDLNNITAESMLWAIREVLDNSRYAENAKRLSKIFLDQPLSPLETAVFWTEYVIRHKGAPHMRSAALDLAWYQYYLLDVIAVLTLAVASVLTALFLLLRAITRKLCGSKNKDNIGDKHIRNIQKKTE